MGLLGDESGYVLVLRKPQVILDDRSSTAEDSQPIPKPVPAIRTGSISVPHCCFYCSWCGQAILLPNDRIGSPFGHPGARKIDVRSIATVCHTCKHIGNYTMFRSCRGFDTRHRVIHAQITGEAALLNWLHCDEPTCTARVPLFVAIDRERPLGEADATEWLWDGMTCALGHRIRRVPVDPAIHLPLRSYSEAR